jgi:hypothetical protein
MALAEFVLLCAEKVKWSENGHRLTWQMRLAYRLFVRICPGICFSDVIRGVLNYDATKMFVMANRSRLVQLESRLYSLL